MTLPLLPRLWTGIFGNKCGSSAVEFALISPVAFAMLFGAMEFGYEMYMNNILQGALAKATRKITLESASDANARAALDQEIRNMMGLTHKEATILITREAGTRFSQFQSRGEPLNDNNHNNQCDAGETYEDVNNNNAYDSQAISQGWGESDDIILYSVKVTFPRLLPIGGLVGLPDTTALTSTQMMRIQPFSNRSRPALRSC